MFQDSDKLAKWCPQLPLDSVCHRKDVNIRTYRQEHTSHGTGELSIPLAAWLPVAPCGGQRGRGGGGGGSGHRGHDFDGSLQRITGAGPCRDDWDGAVPSALGQGQQVVPGQDGRTRGQGQPAPQENPGDGEGEGTIRLGWVAHTKVVLHISQWSSTMGNMFLQQHHYWNPWPSLFSPDWQTSFPKLGLLTCLLSLVVVWIKASIIPATDHCLSPGVLWSVLLFRVGVYLSAFFGNILMDIVNIQPRYLGSNFKKYRKAACLLWKFLIWGLTWTNSIADFYTSSCCERLQHFFYSFMFTTLTLVKPGLGSSQSPLKKDKTKCLELPSSFKIQE